MHTSSLFLIIFGTIAVAQAQCGANLLPCGSDCYLASQYCCVNNQLKQTSQCSGVATPTPATSSAAPTPTPTPTPAPASTCTNMFSNLKCRTSSGDPTQVDSGAVSGARSWLCSNYPEHCTAINTGGQYSSCNTVEQLSYAMNSYYTKYSSQGASACNFGGVAKLVSAASTGSPATSSGSTAAPSSAAAAPVTSASVSCTTMFSGLQCRTSSEDPTQVDSGAVSGARSWLCTNYPEHCTAINSGGQYSSCNSVEQLSYAMNSYYTNKYSSQGTSACYFGGVAKLVGATSAPAPVVNPAPVPRPTVTEQPSGASSAQTCVAQYFVSTSTNSGGYNGRDSSDSIGIRAPPGKMGKVGMSYPLNQQPGIGPEINPTSWAQDNVIWWYYTWQEFNWPAADALGMEFVPMARPGNVDKFKANILNGAYNGVSHMLFFNEPDNPAQYFGDGLDPVTCAQKSFVLFQAVNTMRQQLGNSKKWRIGAPVLAGQDTNWLTQHFNSLRGMCSQIGITCEYDFIHLHIYTRDPVTGWFQTKVNMFRSLGKPMWVSEFARTQFDGQNLSSVADVSAWMHATTSWMQQQPDIERYAWFGTQRATDPPDTNNQVMDKYGNPISAGVQYRQRGGINC